MKVVDRHGWLVLSSASSRTEHPDAAHDPQSCRGCRWFEVRLSSKQHPDDKQLEYRVELVGRTRVNGEVNRVRVEYTTSPRAIVDYLTMGEPGRRYIPKVSRKVLHEAGDIDDDIADALDDFDEITGVTQ